MKYFALKNKENGLWGQWLYSSSNNVKWRFIQSDFPLIDCDEDEVKSGSVKQYLLSSGPQSEYGYNFAVNNESLYEFVEIKE